MRSPSRPPESTRLFTFFLLGILSLIMWGFVFAFWWYFGWYWRGWEPYTALVTLFALPIPFVAYQVFRSTGQPVKSGPTEAPSASTPASAPLPTGAATSDWLTWLGNGDSHRGTLVVLVFLFWSIMYWSMMTLTAFTFASWGLLTIVGVIILRAFFRNPGREVPGAAEPKSKAK